MRVAPVGVHTLVCQNNEASREKSADRIMLYNHEGHEAHEGRNIKSPYFMLFMSFMVKSSVKLPNFSGNTRNKNTLIQQFPITNTTVTRLEH